MLPIQTLLNGSFTPYLTRAGDIKRSPQCLGFASTRMTTPCSSVSGAAGATTTYGWPRFLTFNKFCLRVEPFNTTVVTYPQCFCHDHESKR